MVESDTRVCLLEVGDTFSKANDRLRTYCQTHSLDFRQYTDSAAFEANVRAGTILVVNLSDAPTTASSLLIFRLAPHHKIVVLADETISTERAAELIRKGCMAVITIARSDTELARALDCVVHNERYVSADIGAGIMLSEKSRGGTAHRLPAVLAHLTARERQVIRQLINGQTVEQVYNSTLLSNEEVDLLIERVASSCGVRGLAGLVKLAVSCGLTDLDT